MPGTDTLITDISNEQIVRYGFNPGTFESLDDSTSSIYEFLYPADSVFEVAEPDSFFYMPSSQRIELVKDAYQGVFLQSWTIGLFIFIMILVVSIQVSNQKYFGQLFKASLNTTMVRRMFGERMYSWVHESFRSDLLFLLSSGLFLSHLINYLSYNPGNQTITAYAVSTLLVTVWMVIKMFLYRLSGWIFKTTGEVEEYLFYHQISARVIGLLLLPFGYLLYFTKEATDELIFLLGGFIVLFYSIISIIRGLGIIRKKVFSIYYPILYLCTLEISPIILTGVVLMGWVL
jgi:hypothetical protein